MYSGCVGSRATLAPHDLVCLGGTTMSKLRRLTEAAPKAKPKPEKKAKPKATKRKGAKSVRAKS